MVKNSTVIALCAASAATGAAIGSSFVVLKALKNDVYVAATQEVISRKVDRILFGEHPSRMHRAPQDPLLRTRYDQHLRNGNIVYQDSFTIND